jgi:very-short-patch-repair endonuclease
MEMATRGSYLPYRRKLVTRSRVLRRALTPAEKRLWFDFLRHLPAKFTRQKPLGDYIADFYCASHRLVVEVDGDSHFTADGAKRDSVRDAALRHMGLNIVRFTNDDVMRRFEAVCLEIAALLEKSKL